ncbi:MAG: N-6 DNA methylase [Gammaproteobacteria bacterium]|nr:N-6 DNA methylase [Gammaproteobacteria bacterium]
MSAVQVESWLEGLGYSDQPEFLHRRGDVVPPTHPYALEIHALLQGDGSVRARAVFDVEGVPTIVFLDDDANSGVRVHALDDVRKRIWNQNLATIVLHVRGERAVALPARRLESTEAEHSLRIEEIRPDGPFSASDVLSARLTTRLPDWFDREARVDHKLLDNISKAVQRLTQVGFDGGGKEPQRKKLAELLMGEILFASYLEHRGIVGETYRSRRDVRPLLDMVGGEDRQGVQRLIESLRSDFNGDFLAGDSLDPWLLLTPNGYDLLSQFLRRTDMQMGQEDFWNYDFSHIPVELLSGLYEMFLSPNEQTRQGAFYTPRHLAALAVDQAFVHSENPLAETIFDGACGSGILLTTAYRRLIALSEQQGQPLTFAERCELLQRTIFGGDTNPMACRVTAFSLYLSIFEGLDPADIIQAQERDVAKLPTLKGANLAVGPDAGDFFKDDHAFARRCFSLVISNPPWREPAGSEQTTADDWADSSGAPVTRRQIAGAYALRALDFLENDGRVCLLLPVGQLLGDTSAKFVTRLLWRYQPLRIINFGDLQELLFPTARQACHLFVGQRRPDATKLVLPFRETFDYCVPKADLTLALGHLTLQSADLHRLQTVSVLDNPQQLVTRMWGDASDMSIWTRLTMRGTLAEFVKPSRAERKRVCRKGIHLSDSGATSVSAGPLRDLPHLQTDALKNRSPVLHNDLLGSWPQDQETVVGLNEALMRVFDGPRVVFPDGFSKLEPNLRTYYFDGPATFTHSIGVISSSDEADAPMLKFAAVYLRSNLARYFLMLSAWKVLSSWGGIHLKDVKKFPFFEPDAAPDTAAAQDALAAICQRMDELAELPCTQQPVHYRELRPELDGLVYAYFGLTGEEQALVEESVALLMPSIRPASIGGIRRTPVQQKIDSEDYRAYAIALGESLTRWSTRMGGRGRFRVTVSGSKPTCDGPLGIVRIDCIEGDTLAPEANVRVDDDVALQVLAKLRVAGLRCLWSGSSLSLVPDTHIWSDGSLYLVRPATKRNWTIRQALRDAEHTVRLVQRNATA